MKTILVFILCFVSSSNARYITSNHHQVDIKTIGPKARPGNAKKNLKWLLSNLNLFSCQNGIDGYFIWDQGTERQYFGSRLDELAGMCIVLTVFENQRKSLISHRERSELSLHCVGQKFIKNAKNSQIRKLKFSLKQCYQRGHF